LNLVEGFETTSRDVDEKMYAAKTSGRNQMVFK
jgi:PleD family two-component response regulator